MEWAWTPESESPNDVQPCRIFMMSKKYRFFLLNIVTGFSVRNATDSGIRSVRNFLWEKKPQKYKKKEKSLYTAREKEKPEWPIIHLSYPSLTCTSLCDRCILQTPDAKENKKIWPKKQINQIETSFFVFLWSWFPQSADWSIIRVDRRGERKCRWEEVAGRSNRKNKSPCIAFSLPI